MVELQKIATEQRNPNTMNIDTLSTLDMVKLINREDHRVADAVGLVTDKIAQAVDVIADCLAKGGRLIYCGAGTSGRLGILDAVECPPTYSTDPEMVQALMAGGYGAIFKAVEGAEDSKNLGVEDMRNIAFCKKDVLVGIAASGRTPYVLGCMEYAKKLGAPTISVTCCPGSELDRFADIGIAPAPGPDEVRHRSENGAEHALHRRHDQAGEGLRQSDGGRKALQRKAGAAVRDHRVQRRGVLRGRSRRRAGEVRLPSQGCHRHGTAGRGRRDRLPDAASRRRPGGEGA